MSIANYLQLASLAAGSVCYVSPKALVKDSTGALWLDSTHQAIYPSVGHRTLYVIAGATYQVDRSHCLEYQIPTVVITTQTAATDITPAFSAGNPANPA